MVVIKSLKQIINELTNDPTSIVQEIDETIYDLQHPPEIPPPTPPPDPKKFQAESRARVSEYTKQYQEKKLKLEEALASVNKDAYKSKKDDFVQIYKSIFSMKNDLAAMRAQATALQERHRTFIESFLQKRQSLIQSLKSSLKTINSQIEMVSDLQNVNVSAMEKKLKAIQSKKAAQHKKDLESVTKQIQAVKTKASHLEMQRAEEQRRQRTALQSIEREIRSKQQAELSARREEHSRAKKLLQISSQALPQLQQWAAAESARAPAETFVKFGTGAALGELEAILATQQEQLKSAKVQHAAVLEGLRRSIAGAAKKRERALENARAALERDRAAAETEFVKGEERRRKELAVLLRKKEAEYQAKAEAARRANAKDLEERRDEISRFSTSRSTGSGGTTLASTSALQKKKAQYQSMLAFITREVETRRAELPRALAAAEKEQRMVRRRIEKEKREMRERYEREIGALQVHMRESLDNLAALYERDECERAREVVEALRRLRRTQEEIILLPSPSPPAVAAKSDSKLAAARRVLAQEAADFEAQRGKLLRQMEEARARHEAAKAKLLAKAPPATPQQPPTPKNDRPPPAPAPAVFREVAMDARGLDRALEQCSARLTRTLEKAAEQSSEDFARVGQTARIRKLIATALELGRTIGEKERALLALLTV